MTCGIPVASHQRFFFPLQKVVNREAWASATFSSEPPRFSRILPLLKGASGLNNDLFPIMQIEIK